MLMSLKTTVKSTLFVVFSTIKENEEVKLEKKNTRIGRIAPQKRQTRRNQVHIAIITQNDSLY